MKITCMICGGIILKSCICWILKDLPNTKTLLNLACPALEFFQDLVFFVKQDLIRRIFQNLLDLARYTSQRPFNILGDITCKNLPDLERS